MSHTSPRLEALLNARDRIDQEITLERATLKRLATLTADARAATAVVGPDVRGVLAFIARLYEIDWTDITSPGRNTEHLEARQVACAVLRRYGLSYPAIGRAVNRDHTSVMAAIRRVDMNPDLTLRSRTAWLALTGADDARDLGESA